MTNYVLFTGQNCNPCETVKSMLAQGNLPAGINLEIVDASLDPRVVDFVVRTVPTLVNLDNKEQTTGVFNIMKVLHRD